jgi:hypothetical protein
MRYKGKCFGVRLVWHAQSGFWQFMVSSFLAGVRGQQRRSANLLRGKARLGLGRKRFRLTECETAKHSHSLGALQFGAMRQEK